MKWIGLIVLLGAIPILAALLRGTPGARRWIWMGLGLLPFVIQKVNFDVAPISWAYWPGHTKGIEFSVVDTFALAVLLAHGRGPRWPQFTVIWVLYAASAVLSIAWASVPVASTFTAWQAMRVVVVFLAVARICTKPAGVMAVLHGMMLGILINAGSSLMQHLQGVAQATGLFGHQNTLGMMAHFIAFPAAALLLAQRNWFAWLAIAATLLVGLLGASRATIGLQAAGFLLLAFLAVTRRRTPRNFAFLVGSLASLAILAPVAMTVLAPRLAAAENSTYDERAAFAKAANLMIADHPWGVGANQYVTVANTQGYSSRGGVTWALGSRSANVHNTYLLTAAEQGIAALGPLLLLLFVPPVLALRTAFKFRRDPKGALLLGCAVTALVVAAHCFYEWVFVNYPVQVVFAANIGMIVGLVAQCKAGARKQRRLVRAPGPLTPLRTSLRGGSPMPADAGRSEGSPAEA